jgi:hypothetical protein
MKASFTTPCGGTGFGAGRGVVVGVRVVEVVFGGAVDVGGWVSCVSVA